MRTVNRPFAELLGRAGLSQKALGELTGVSNTTLSNVRHGMVPSPKVQLTIATALAEKLRELPFHVQNYLWPIERESN